MNNELISREALKKAIEQYQIQWNKNCETDIAKWDSCESILAIINHAPTVTPTFGLFKEMLCSECEKRPQGELAEKLKDRIEESVCKYCQMNKHCELCEISRVFQIITLTAEEQKGGAE